jgi:hypothetical protein
MNSFSKSAILVGLALALQACTSASSLLNNKSAVPQASNIRVGNALAMPPDLQLPPPGQTSDGYQPNDIAETAVAQTRPIKKVSTAGLPPLATLSAAKPDIFDQYGISKFKADGTKKTTTELSNELRAAMVKKKREANPGYGTIANIGNIFKDQ